MNRYKKRFRFASILSTLATLGVPALMVAQVLPGGHPRDKTSQIRLRQHAYQIEVLNDIREMFSDWDRAWTENDAEKLSEFYAFDGQLALPGDRATARGAYEIRAVLDEMVSASGRFRSNMNDFEVGNDLAFFTSNFTFDSGSDEGTGVAVSGKQIVVLRREGDEWRIRSHWFRIGN